MVLSFPLCGLHVLLLIRFDLTNQITHSEKHKIWSLAIMALRLKKEYSYTSSPLLGLCGLF